MDAVLTLRAGRDRSVRRRHPWILSGSVAEVRGDPAPGATVLVRAADGTALGRAQLSPGSSLRARMWTFDPDEAVDDAFIASRVAAAVDRRDGLVPTEDAQRLVFSEADGLPGVIADRYGEVVVCQLSTSGADAWRDVVADVLAALPGVATVYERSDGDGREREGLPPRTGLLRGPDPPAELVITEGPWRFAIEVRGGHKTGFYLDQRDARAAAARLAGGRRVLDVFAYIGAFSAVAGASGAAAVTAIDSSGPALARLPRQAELNGAPPAEVIEGDAFTELRRLRDRAASFDLIVLDPPKLAKTASQVERASRAYKDLNLLAAKLLAPGGLLLTFSCSAGMTAELFRKVVAGAAFDAQRDLRVVGRLGQPADHPVPLAFPEAEYLTGLVLRAD